MTAKNSCMEKMLALLDLFTQAAPVWSADELIQFMGASRSTGYKYIRTLHRANLLAAVGNGSYVLGPRILELDRQLRLCDPLYEIAGPVLEDLTAKTQWPSLVTVLYSNSVMCIRSEGVPVPDGFFDRGQSRPLFRGAASKVILAHLPFNQLNKLFESHRTAIAQSKLGGDWDTFRTKLREIREAGFCKTDSEFTRGIVGIASPIFNRESRIIGSIGIGTRTSALRREAAPLLIDSVKKAAQTLTASLASIETPLDLPARAVGRA